MNASIYDNAISGLLTDFAEGTLCEIEGESFIRGSVSDHILLQHQTPPQAYLKVSGADDLSSVELGNSENGSVKEKQMLSNSACPRQQYENL
ncbi:hypothetical protein LXL04_019231 [Taraxacum kok-saghyz]